MQITFIPILGLPRDITDRKEVLPDLIEALTSQAISFQDGDILAVSHKFLSKAYGAYVDLSQVEPSEQAQWVAARCGKRPELVELVLAESQEVFLSGQNLICYRPDGNICANAGLDLSNSGSIDRAVRLSTENNEWARSLSEAIGTGYDAQVAVIVCDTQGRALRSGIVGVAVGCWGIASVKSYIGAPDLYGHNLRVSQEAIVDELASGASLLMGQADAAIPAVLIRGYAYAFTPSDVSALYRPKKEQIFRPAAERLLPQEALPEAVRQEDVHG